MRLLIVWFMFLDTSFYANNNVRVFEAMANLGHEVISVLPVVTEVPLRNVKTLTVKQIVVHKYLPILTYLYFYVKATQNLMVRRFDVIIISPDMLPWIFPILVARKVFGIGRNLLLAVREGSPPVELGTSSRGYFRYALSTYRTIAMHLCRFCDFVFAVSPMHANEVATKFNVPDVRVWSPSVDEIIFNPARYVAGRKEKREQLSISDKYVLIYHGIVSHERGLRELLQALVLVREQTPDIVLLILGAGGGEATLRLAASNLGLRGNVIFHEAVPYEEVPLFIAAADAGVVPLPVEDQWRRQTPIKLLEYLAMEKPVILTETESHRWIIGDGQAFFCGAGRPEQIARAIMECRGSSAKDHIGMRENIVARFSSKAIANRVLAMFDQVASQN